MKVTSLAIPDVKVLEPKLFGDERGFLTITWENEAFRRDVADVEFIQDNHSRSRHGTLRGMHFQLEHTQGKLVRCTVGRVLDVVVDVRRSSSTFGQWVSTELTGENHHQLWVPPGFAHGFLVLSESADLHYKVTGRYDPQSERTLRWDDPAVGIPWPLEPGTRPLLSPKDMLGLSIDVIETLP